MFQGWFLQFLSLCLHFRCLQSMSEKEVEAYVLTILQAIAINKKMVENIYLYQKMQRMLF